MEKSNELYDKLISRLNPVSDEAGREVGVVWNQWDAEWESRTFCLSLGLFVRQR